MSEPSDLSELEDFKARLAVEYGTYVASQPIFHDGALAYNAGQPVPVSNVERHGYYQNGLVRHVDDPAPEPAAAAVLPVGEPTVVDEQPTEEPEEPTEMKD